MCVCVCVCVWVASGFLIRIGTDAPRRVKAATREGHPAPWLAGELDPRGAQSEEAPGFSFTWSCSVRYSRHPAAYVPPQREPRRRAASTRERMSATGGPATRVVSSSLSALFFVRFALLNPGIISPGPLVCSFEHGVVCRIDRCYKPLGAYHVSQ